MTFRGVSEIAGRLGCEREGKGTRVTDFGGPPSGPFLEKILPKREKRSQRRSCLKSTSPEILSTKGIFDNILKLGKMSLTAETPVRNRLGLPAILEAHIKAPLTHMLFCTRLVRKIPG